MNQLLLGIVMAVSLILIIVSGVAGYYLGRRQANSVPFPSPTAALPSFPTLAPTAKISPPGSGAICTMDAKQCPDGSWVGRQPPRCEFAPCPGEGKKIPSPTPESDATQTVDFDACRVGSGYSLAVGFGSTSLRILKNEDSVCVVRTVNEVEGGITESQCSVPKSLGTVTFLIKETGTDFSSIKPYCNVNSTTNVNIGN